MNDKEEIEQSMDYESGGDSKCCGAEIKNGFCSGCKEHCEPEKQPLNIWPAGGLHIIEPSISHKSLREVGRALGMEEEIEELIAKTETQPTSALDEEIQARQDAGEKPFDEPTPTGLDELVRDVTKLGSIPKSEARRRILAFARSEYQWGLKELAKRLPYGTDVDLDGCQTPQDGIQRTLGHGNCLSKVRQIIKEMKEGR